MGLVINKKMNENDFTSCIVVKYINLFMVMSKTKPVFSTNIDSFSDNIVSNKEFNEIIYLLEHKFLF